MIGDQHQMARRHFGFQAAGRISQNDAFYTQPAEDSHREDDLLHRIAFVVMKSSLLDGDRNAADLAEHETARVALDGGADEIWDLVIRDRNGVLKLVGECTESAAEDDDYFWSITEAASDKFGGLAGVFESVKITHSLVQLSLL